MTGSNQFWHLAEEAMLDACKSKTEKEKLALLDLARTWAQAALKSEGPFNKPESGLRPTW